MADPKPRTTVGGRFEIDAPKGRARCTNCGAFVEGELHELLRFTGTHARACPGAPGPIVVKGGAQ